MTTARRRARSFRVIFCVAVSIAASPALAQQGPSPDVFDQFFRFGDTEHKVRFQEAPGETVDPFTGQLQLLQEDLYLPGKAGHDLRIIRRYSSKIWARADLRTSITTLLAEGEHSVLGYGWSFHMGRLLSPDPVLPPAGCNAGEYPVFEGPDGISRVFYPASNFTTTNPTYVSKDFWRLETRCLGASGGDGACVWSDTGTKYELANTGGNPFWIGTRHVWPVSAVVDPFGNQISVSYAAGTGAATEIVDSYERHVGFVYQSGDDGLRLTRMTANGRDYQYVYTTYTSSQTAGEGKMALQGARRFLTEVRPPAGSPYRYEYAVGETVANNQYALSRITYPSGGTTAYEYRPVNFFTGRETVGFQAVTLRTVAGLDPTDAPTATWGYAYSSPPANCGSSNACSVDPGTGLSTDHHVTTVNRPDGMVDTYRIAGFGYVADNSTATAGSDGSINYLSYLYLVGITFEEARANRTEVISSSWSPVFIASAWHSAPVYSEYCGPYVVDHPVVAAPVQSERWIQRDGATFNTHYTDFDAYAQPRTVIESGYLADIYSDDSHGPPPVRMRTTSWTYRYDQAEHMLRNRPSAQHVCIEGECYDNGWTYDGLAHAPDSETLSGVTTHFGHHASGDLASVTNALRETLTLSDYAYGVARQVDFNGVYRVMRTASLEGWITSETDGRGAGFTTTYQYDAIGRSTVVTPPGSNAPTSYDYQPDGLPDGQAVRMTKGGYSRTSTLDGFGRVKSTRDSEGVLTRTIYDKMRNVRFRSYPYDAASPPVGDLTSYDGLGRPLEVTKAAYPPDEGPSTPRTCEGDGQCLIQAYYYGNCTRSTVQRSSTDAVLGWRCAASYGDPQERRLASASDGRGSIWRYAYSAAGKLRAVTAPLAQGNREYVYDANQYLRSETTGESGVVTYLPNAIGQVLSRTDARSITATYHYDDPLSRLTAINWGTDDDVTGRTYDKVNNLKHVETRNSGTFDLGWDELNRPASQDWTYRGITYQTRYVFDAMGCLRTMTYPTGTQLTFTCDTLNRVKSVKLTRLGGQEQWIVSGDVTYHPSGQPALIPHGNGVTTTLGHDDRARLKTLDVRLGTVRFVGVTYSYDGADNVVGYEDAARAGSLRTMTYDEADRLWTVVAPAQWGTLQYGYDELGNRKEVSRSSDAESWSSQSTYDATTNRLATSQSGGPNPTPRTLVWDAPGHLASSVVGSEWATYRYDHAGRRVEMTDGSGTTIYHYDASGRVIAETTAGGAKLRDYVYLGDKLVAVDGCVSGNAVPCTVTTEWYHTDALGSVLARTNSSGAVVAQLDYEPFGERWSFSGSSADGDRQYNGRVYDAGTGFHDYGARLYWPEIGRFISADSYLGDPGNPASLNRYSYVHNNPYKYVDPSGRDPVQSRILNDPRILSGEYLERSGLGGPTVGDLSNQGQLRDAVGSNGGQFQGMQQSEQNLLAVEQGALEAFPVLVGVGLSTVGAGSGPATGEAAPAGSGPRPSPKFEPPTNPAQAPPSEVPAGWRVRQMGATKQYPNGYWKLEKPMKDGSWQPIDPSTMKPGTRPQTHVPLPPKKPE